MQRCVVKLCVPMGLAQGWTRDWASVRRKVWGGLRACRNQRNAIPRLRRGKQIPMRALGAGDEIDRGQDRGRNRHTYSKGGRQVVLILINTD